MGEAQGGQFERFLRSRAPSSDTLRPGIGYNAGTVATDCQEPKVGRTEKEKERKRKSKSKRK